MKISTPTMCYSTTKKLQDNVYHMYSDLGNQSQVYDLTLKLGDIRQGENNVTKYFNTLKQLWKDLNFFNDYKWKFTYDYNHCKKTKDFQIYEFLAGLDIEFDEVRGRIIGNKLITPISNVFSKVKKEKSRKGSCLENKQLEVLLRTLHWLC